VSLASQTHLSPQQLNGLKHVVGSHVLPPSAIGGPASTSGHVEQMQYEPQLCGMGSTVQLGSHKYGVGGQGMYPQTPFWHDWYSEQSESALHACPLQSSLGHCR
jgi:hypothetical protein